MDSADSGSQLGREPVLENRENANLRPDTALSDTMAAGYTATALDSNKSVFHGSGIQHTGKGHFNVHGNVNITPNPPPDSREDEECKKALFVTDPSEDRAMLKRKKGNRASGTCEWILKTEKLKTWLHFEETEQKSQSNNILWLHGNPGTGKSTMAIYLTEELSTIFDAMKNMTLAYFFCDASFEKRKTATSIIRGLLYQLVQRHKNLLSKYILPAYKERRDQLFTSFDALWRVFLAAAADQETGQKYCIIDALDECDNDSKDTLLCQLYETFHCQEKPPPNLSILITSRPYPEIREYLQDFINADLASFDQAKQDIDRCIKERVDGLAKKKNYTDKVKREIIALLIDKAEGTFLWVGLACEELRGKPSKDAIQFLRDMPRGLISLYASLLKSATEDKTSECVAIRRILSFVVVSFEALTVRALSEACRLHQDEPDLDTRLQYTRDQIASCRLLVVVNDQKVQLLHQSVRDFLTSSGSGIFVERLEAHASVASRCIDNLIERLQDTSGFWKREDWRVERSGWLSPSWHSKTGLFQPFQDNSNIWQHKYDFVEMEDVDIQWDTDDTFLDYAETYWTKHVREAGERFKICEPQIPFFETNSISRQRWITRRYSHDSNHNLLNIAIDFGLPILVEYALGVRDVHPNMGGSAFNIKTDLGSLYEETNLSPLSCALLSFNMDGNTKAEMLNMLLKAGATVTRTDMKYTSRQWVDQEMALTLLHHMHPETRMAYIHELLGEEEGCENEFIPSILAKYGDQVDVEEKFVNAAVSSSIGMGILPFLLIQRRGRIAITELMIKSAAKNEWQGSEIVKCLLEYSKDQILITEDIMKKAAKNKRQGSEIVKCLLEYSKDQILMKNVAEDIMKKAAKNERQGSEIVKCLLEYSKDQILITEDIMKNAAKNERQGSKIVKCLLEYSKDQILITEDIMKNAAKNERQGIKLVKCLLKYQGNEISITENVIIAATDNLEQGGEIIQLLHQYQSDKITITTNILKAAVSQVWRGIEFVKLLLSLQGDKILITESIILAAIYNRYHGTEIIQLLCQHQSGKIKLTTKIMQAAVRSGQGGEFLEPLLRHRDDQTTVAITTDLLLFGMTEYNPAGEHCSALFQDLGNSFYIPDDAMITAIESIENCEEFIDFLIQEGGVHILITDEIVEAVLDAKSRGYEHRILWMEMFFKHKQKLKFSGKALVTICEFRQNLTSESRKRKRSEYEEENLESDGEFEGSLLEAW